MATAGESANSEKTTLKLRCSCFGHEQDVRSIAPLTAPDISGFVSGSRDLTARVWISNESDQGFSERLVTSGHSKFISAVCVLPPDDAYPHGVILTGSNDHSILAYTVTSPQPIYQLLGHTDTVCSLSAGKFGSVISGSWDKSAKVWIKEKCAMTLQGHEAAVWSVVIMPEKGYMLTGSADKTIKLWKAGKCERSFLGHTDCVRGLAVLSGSQFLSCSNDATVRRWLVSGSCAQVYYGHTNFVYSVAGLPNGIDFVSSGEDRTMRVWRGGSGECVQTIAHPTQSVWCVCILPDGDVVTGSSDGVIRVFTMSAERVADPEQIAAFMESVGSSTIPAQIGDIKTDELVGPDALRQPGTRDGQTLMIRRGDAIEAHQWDQTTSLWMKIGDVVGGSGGSQSSSGKVLFEGKEYDYVFDVEIYENQPPLKLPYNSAEDPWHAAQKFLEKNEISQMFLDQVANFIQQQTGGVTLGAASPANTASDPFTGSGRYVPGSSSHTAMETNDSCSTGDPLTGGSRYIPGTGVRSQTATSSNAADPFTGSSSYRPGGSQVQAPPPPVNAFYPETNYIKFDQVNIQGIFAKLREFNVQVGESSRLTDVEMKVLETVVQSKTEPTAPQLDILWRLLHWPSGLLFPTLDILRHCLRSRVINARFCATADGAQFISYAVTLLSHDALPINHRLILRALCNAFLHPAGEALLVANSEAIIEAVLKLHHPASDKQVQIALSSLILNLAIAFRKTSNAEGLTRCLMAVAELSQSQTESEAYFRILVAIGTAITDDKKCLELAKSLDLSNFIVVCQADETPKISECASLLAKRLQC